jgi:hypothetical protein
LSGLIAVLRADQQGRAWNVEFDGEIVIVGSRDPEFDFARILVARGLTGSVKILEGKTGKLRSTITDIVKAADLCTEEGPHGPRFVKRRQRRVDRAQAAETALADAGGRGRDANAP